MPREESPEPEGIEVPWRELSDAVLRNLVEAFVAREGTDYGAVERSLADKVEDVLHQLRRGEARLLFDPETETTNIVSDP